MRHLVLISLLVLTSFAQDAKADRLKDLVTVDGFRSNQLTGFGIVVGLNGTGDDARSPVIRRSIAKMLKRLGVTVDASEIKAKNVAAVIVTAELPPFARAGMKLDITVSSMGAAKSLQGGTLIATPLKGADLATYAIAQGPMSLGGFAASGGTGSSSTKNHVTAGRIPGGAIVEVDAPGMMPRSDLLLVLNQPDFTTATRIAQAIDTAMGSPLAIVRDPGAVTVRVDKAWKGRVVQLVASLESIEASPDVPARVIIDERTGTVVVGEHVRLGRAAIAHGALTVEISESFEASQPGILAKGETVVTPKTDLKVTEHGGDLRMIEGAATVGDVVGALNALGAKPRDLVSIFQALKAAGALRAEIQML